MFLPRKLFYTAIETLEHASVPIVDMYNMSESVPGIVYRGTETFVVKYSP